MYDVDTLVRFYKQVKDQLNDEAADEHAVFYNLKAIVNSLNIEKRNNTDNDTLDFIIKQQLEIQREKDPRVIECNQIINILECEGRIYNQSEKQFHETLFDFAHALSREANELEDETRWKGWTSYLGNGWDKKEGNRQFSAEHIYNMRMEAIDCLKFLAIIFNILDMDVEMIREMFIEKTNIKKEQWEKENK